MDKHKKNIGVTAELLTKQPDKVDGGVAIVEGQRTAHSNDARLLLSLNSGLSGQGALESCNTLPAMPLFRQR